MQVMTSVLPLDDLRAAFGKRLRLNQPLARYTSARIGGSADALLDITASDELAETAQALWGLGLPFVVLGGGSNMLVSDAGVREVVIFNQASAVRFQDGTKGPVVWGYCPPGSFERLGWPGVGGRYPGEYWRSRVRQRWGSWWGRFHGPGNGNNLASY